MQVEELKQNEEVGMSGLLMLGDGEREGAGVLLLLLGCYALVAGVILGLLGLLVVNSVSRARWRAMGQSAP